MDTIAGVQNPLFCIVTSQYLRGLEQAELSRMINFFGNRMGLKFDDSAVSCLFDAYGGHPLLTRKACSHIHSKFALSGQERPIPVTGAYITSNLRNINSEIEFYFKHVLSELERFYPDEYTMLTYAVSGQQVDFSELARDTQLTRHITQYGLLKLGPSGQPIFLIDAIQGYLARDAARREGRRHTHKIISGDAREAWLRSRLIALVKDFRHLNDAARESLGYYLFTGETVSRPEDFIAASNAVSLSSFKSFLSTLNMLVNENIDLAGKKQKHKSFFFGWLKDNMPSLFDALHRLRIYRHALHHDRLLPDVEGARRHYLERDLDQVKEDFSDDELLILQQILLDELFLALQDEISRLAS